MPSIVSRWMPNPVPVGSKASWAWETVEPERSERFAFLQGFVFIPNGRKGWSPVYDEDVNSYI